MFTRKLKKQMTLNTERIKNYTHFIEIPLKIAGCWDWYPNTNVGYYTIINNIYLSLVLYLLTNVLTTLIVTLYTEWGDIMVSLHKMSDCLPFFVSINIVAYFAVHKADLYDLVRFMNERFEYYSAYGLTNMTMLKSYQTARNFGYAYTACTMFSVTIYVLPDAINLFKGQALENWVYLDVNGSPFSEIVFLRQCFAQGVMGLAIGQLGVFFAANAVLLCGQLDLLCCSLRNVRYTAMLCNGVQHAAIAAVHSDIQTDELYNYIYNRPEMKPSLHSFNKNVNTSFMDKTTQFDIYSTDHDEATCAALSECARVYQLVNIYKEKFEAFVSPLLVLRVVQVTLYLCTLLYEATSKFDMVTAEYLSAAALDIFVYCYYGNQIITQAERVSTAAYQCSWHTMGVKPRRMLTNLLLASQRSVVIRAGRFVHMDLHTYVNIIKTSFSYYTLLVNVNEKH
ncbi:putative odorant receptor 85e [Achroia grisella]|uniref:putative odorant receptor 85e n=1 Tax=Achroia grisella TaxID=688607 RepID=UPI0027D34F9F|nr:putative odorant receptor 85e [Achroia grisella]